MKFTIHKFQASMNQDKDLKVEVRAFTFFMPKKAKAPF